MAYQRARTTSQDMRLPAKYRRAAVKGQADQLAYEATERQERADMRTRMTRGRKKPRPRSSAPETGANAGTMGGSRTLVKAFFGQK